MVFLGFDHVRVPRENMLAKNAKVSPTLNTTSYVSLPLWGQLFCFLIWFVNARISNLQEGNVFYHARLFTGGGGGGFHIITHDAISQS